MRSITSCVSCVLLGCAGSPASHTAIDAGATGAPDAPPFDVPDGGCAETPAWTGHDDVAPSQAPPAGLAREQVPQFVSFGFDDNFRSDAILWILDDLIKGKTNPPGAHDACTSDGTPVHASFYLSTTYITTDGATEDEGAVRAAWRREYTDGNEMADHTHLHADGTNFSVDQWKAEMQTCIQWLTDPSKGVGVHAEEIIGFRTPFLLYSDKTYVALHDLGFRYDCTIEDGFQGDRDASSDTWPYTLDHGSPADGKIGAHAGLWELPVYPVVVPPDDKCAQYGVPSGLRAKMKKIDPTFDLSTGKITGLDYNLWIIYRMTKAEFVATLEYTLDQHLAGNRAPFMIGAHPDLYSIEPPDDPTPNSTYQDRRAALAEFLDYALSKPDVRVVPNRVILDWLRAPVPL